MKINESKLDAVFDFMTQLAIKLDQLDQGGNPQPQPIHGVEKKEQSQKPISHVVAREQQGENSSFHSLLKWLTRIFGGKSSTHISVINDDIRENKLEVKQENYKKKSNLEVKKSNQL